MVIHFIVLLASFFGLYLGGGWLVDGARNIGNRLKISPFVLGLTLVAFGTSAPELVVSHLAVLQNKFELIYGNIIGSNIANTLLIIGATAVVFPMSIASSFLKEKIYFYGFVLFALSILIFHPFQPQAQIAFFEGLILLLIFGVYLFRVITHKNEIEDSQVPLSTNVYKDIAIFIAGCVVLPLSGHFVIQASTAIALTLGVSEALVSLLAIALGTSLPELVTSIIAAKEKQADLVMGNIIGSNIFNIVLILGVSSLVKALPYNSIFQLDFLVLWGAFVLILLILNLSKEKQINRFWGFVFLSLYCLYVISISIRG